MRQRLRIVVLWLVLVLVAWAAYAAVATDSTLRDGEEGQLAADLHGGLVERMVTTDDHLDVYLADGDAYRVWVASPRAWREYAHQYDVLLEEEDDRLTTAALVLGAGGLGLLVVVWARRRMTTRGLQGFAEMRKSRARLLSETSHARFDDVAGATEAKERLMDVVAYLKAPERWRSAGVRLSRGVLMEGPPGCGKTLLARAVAGEAGVPFFYVSGSEFVEMLVGVGAARVRDLFEEAAKQAPAVVFIDELDAIGRRRGSGVGPSHEEREQTLNQLLVALDGVEGRGGDIVVLAATNRADILDPALLRPGRFDAQVRLGALDTLAREAALRIHLRGRMVDVDVHLSTIAAETEGWSGAELENLTNEAALLAARRAFRTPSASGPVKITHADLRVAIAARAARLPDFDQLDAALVGSASQLVRPSAPISVEVRLVSGQTLSGQLVWVDATLVKLQPDDPEAPALVVPKLQVQSLSRRGARVSVEAVPDPWAGQVPEVG